MSPGVDQFVRRFPLCGDRCSRYTVAILIAMIVLFPVYQYTFHGFEITQWDLLLVTGLLTFTVGLRRVRTIPARFRQTLIRLSNRGVLVWNNETQTHFLSQNERHAEQWARIVGSLAALALILAFSFVMLNQKSMAMAPLAAMQAVGAYVAGTFLGRLVYYGQIGSALGKESIDIAVDPFHVDGVGGLKSIGDYFFFQAMIVAIPAIFLAVWWFLFPIWPRDYSHWQQPYFGLMLFAISIELLAFAVPLFAFHKIMLEKKVDWLKKADAMCLKIRALQGEIGQGTSSDNHSDPRPLLEELSNYGDTLPFT